MTSKSEPVGVIVHRAESVGSRDDPPITTITIGPQIPKLPDVPRETPLADYLAPLDLVYDSDASEIALALHDALPGGTFDRLVIRLLEIKASHFRVSWVR